MFETGRQISLHAHTDDGSTALCAALDLPASGSPPDWVHLLPAGEIRTGDGRGPYRVKNAASLIAASMEAMSGAGVIDENHATDLAAPRGETAPARGWIKELQARQDGIWGRVEWTDDGGRLVSSRAYRGLSPVIKHDRGGNVIAVLRASLVNKPNLRGLTTLHQENDMTLLEKLQAALGLDANTTEEKLVEIVTALHAEKAGKTDDEAIATALQAQLAPIARAAGLKDGADAAAVLAGIEQLKTADAGDITKNKTVVALQAELTTVATELKTLKETRAKDKATAFVDGAIKAGRVGVKPMRDDYIALHMENPAKAEKLIGAMPVLGGGGMVLPNEPPAKDGEIALQAEQRQAAALLGIDPKDYAATLKAEREAEAAL